MADPKFYPHPVSGPERRDSHISAVFLTGSLVYKLKKPFDFGFLDYTGLETRRRMCDREVFLNRRLSSGVYDSVVEVRRNGEQFHLGGDGDVVEYAVKMQQLPDGASLSNLLLGGGVRHEQMILLGRRLGVFYSLSERSPEIDRYGRAETIDFNTEENFRQLAPYVGVLFRQDPFDFIREASRGFFKDCRQLFQRRIEEGRIRDGHGDLRAEHVYLMDEIQIIDCIEFNDRFRYGDVAADLAFLHMDMERLGPPEHSLSVLAGYVEKSRDFGIFTVLDFYSCYRALVKLKVACLTWSELEKGSRGKEMETRAGQYLDLALRYAVQFSRRTIWVFCGLPGTGKSTLAAMVAETFGIALLRSDEVRKELPEYGSHSGPVPLDTGIYRRDLRGRAYARLLGLAQEELKKGRSVVLDATFSQRHWREEMVRLAEDLDTSVLFFECVASEKTMLARAGRRRTGEDDQSDARPEHIAGLQTQFEKITELRPELHAVIDTEHYAASESLEKILLQAYAMRRTQVERIIERL
jgi:aminoglycoside phosphotransferase family enzyme/predicted kinase